MNQTILFICTGNICRSPLAAGIYAVLEPEDRVLSAGLSTMDGLPASAHMLALAPAYGADLTSHRSRQLTAELLNQADFVVCLSASHAMCLAPIVPEEKLRILGGGISDPYGGGPEEYRACAAQIAAALPALRRELHALDRTQRSDGAPAQPVQIIPMEESHIPAAAALEQQCFALPWSEQSLRDGLENEYAHYLAALAQGEFAGYLGISQIADQADIANIAVSPAYRRQGIAHALLARAETQAILRGCGEIRLECREGNAAALALYQSRGYTEVGRRKKYYHDPEEDAILMTLFIY